MWEIKTGSGPPGEGGGYMGAEMIPCTAKRPSKVEVVNSKFRGVQLLLFWQNEGQ